jgi:hypothetical protein
MVFPPEFMVKWAKRQSGKYFVNEVPKLCHAVRGGVMLLETNN